MKTKPDRTACDEWPKKKNFSPLKSSFLRDCLDHSFRKGDKNWSPVWLSACLHTCPKNTVAAAILAHWMAQKNGWRKTPMNLLDWPLNLGIIMGLIGPRDRSDNLSTNLFDGSLNLAGWLASYMTCWIGLFSSAGENVNNWPYSCRAVIGTISISMHHITTSRSHRTLRIIGIIGERCGSTRSIQEAAISRLAPPLKCFLGK